MSTAATDPASDAVPPSAAAPSPVVRPPAGVWRKYVAAALAVAAVGLGAVWFLTRDDDATPITGPTSSIVAEVPGASSVPTESIVPSTAASDATSTAVETTAPTPETTLPPETLPPTTPAPTTIPPPAETAPPEPDPSTVPESAPIGAEWLNDGNYPAPEFQFVGGDYLVDLGYLVEAVLGPDGFQIWLETIVDDTQEFLFVRLEDAVAIELTERTDLILGATSCSIGGQPTPGVVGVFLFEDAPELTQALEVWVIDSATNTLVPTDLPAACANEGFGV